MKKQLKMWRPAALPIPSTILPEGFTLRTMRRGEEADWSFCCLGQFDVDAATAAHFYAKMDMQTIAREDVFFLCQNDRPVGTATAHWNQGEPFLHYIAIHPDFRGKGLAMSLLQAVLARHAAKGRQGCFLTTDDYRLAAIKSYVKIGFAPVMWSDDGQARWRLVFDILQTPAPQAFTTALLPFTQEEER